jgi:hypothetical protein
MKKNFCFLLMMLALGIAHAQKGHLSFLGVSMDSDKETFVGKMEGRGFVTDMEQGVSVMMTGNYMGEEITLLVGFTPKTQQVYCVTVMFLPFTAHTFASLETNITAQYGESFRKVDDSAKVRGDAKGMTVWKIEGKETGFVTLTQNKSRDNPLSLIFLDGTNRLLYQDELADE